MHRRQYERLAAILAWRYSSAIGAMQAHGDEQSVVASVVHGIAVDVARMCKEENPSFDFDRFMRAVTG